ncbi:MAG: oxidoreductase [Verrucomicrobiota bacterium]
MSDTHTETDLRSRSVVLTGASAGIGYVTAEKLSQRGHRVVAGARRLDRLAPLAELGVTVLPLDLRDAESIAAFAQAAGETLGEVDCLINNAGFGVYGAIEDVTPDEAAEQFEVNVLGPSQLTGLLLPGMRQRGSGRLIHLGSMGGKTYTPLGAWYHASKHAIEGWADCLRIEVAPFGIDSVLVAPGAIGTEFCEVAIGPLVERSAGGPYERIANRMADTIRKTFDGGFSSPPECVADLLVKLVETNRRPKPRYAVGRFARSIIIARRLLGDRLYDRLVHKFM